MNHGDVESTSAEPTFLALQICQRVVIAHAIAGTLHDVPLITKDEVQEAHGLCARIASGQASPAEMSRAKNLVDEKEERREAREFFASEWAYGQDEVKAAALSVETAAQLELQRLGGIGAVVEDKRLGLAIWNAQSQAHRAVFAVTGGRTAAKEIQRHAAGEQQPLTLCRGKLIRKLPVDELRRVAPAYLERFPDGAVWVGGDGCFTIIADSSEPRHPNQYCQRCSKRTGRTRNAGLTKAAIKRIRRGWA